jgi:hypothetical protein
MIASVFLTTPVLFVLCVHFQCISTFRNPPIQLNLKKYKSLNLIPLDSFENSSRVDLAMKIIQNDLFNQVRNEIDVLGEIKSLGNKIDNTAMILNSKIDNNAMILNSKIDNNTITLNYKIDELEKDMKKLDAKITPLQSVYFIAVASFGALVAVIWMKVTTMDFSKLIAAFQ